jgi:hypothetical protein
MNYELRIKKQEKKISAFAGVGGLVLGFRPFFGGVAARRKTAAFLALII